MFVLSCAVRFTSSFINNVRITGWFQNYSVSGCMGIHPPRHDLRRDRGIHACHSFGHVLIGFPRSVGCFDSELGLQALLFRRRSPALSALAFHCLRFSGFILCPALLAFLVCVT